MLPRLSERRYRVTLILVCILGVVSILCCLYVTDSGYNPSEVSGLRGAGRRLPGYNFNSDQLMGAEVGLILGVLIVLLFLACLCSCCCGGGSCSLCDILACVCLYEICCDDKRIGDFQIM